jgi:hypothetical protein
MVPFRDFFYKKIFFSNPKFGKKNHGADSAVYAAETGYKAASGFIRAYKKFIFYKRTLE